MGSRYCCELWLCIDLRDRENSKSCILFCFPLKIILAIYPGKTTHRGRTFSFEMICLPDVSPVYFAALSEVVMLIVVNLCLDPLFHILALKIKVSFVIFLRITFLLTFYISV